MPFFLGSAQRLVGEIALQSTGRLREDRHASDHFASSIAVLQPIQADNELALAYAGYGRLYEHLGKIGEARTYLTRALEIFERLGTLIEPDKVRAGLAELPAS